MNFFSSYSLANNFIIYHCKFQQMNLFPQENEIDQI